MHLPEYAKSETLLFLVFPLSTYILDDSYNSRPCNGVLTAVFTENSVPELTKGSIQVLVHAIPNSNKRFTVLANLIFV